MALGPMSIGWTERELIKVLVDEISSVGAVCWADDVGPSWECLGSKVSEGIRQESSAAYRRV